MPPVSRFIVKSPTTGTLQGNGHRLSWIPPPGGARAHPHQVHLQRRFKSCVRTLLGPRSGASSPVRALFRALSQRQICPHPALCSPQGPNTSSFAALLPLLRQKVRAGSALGGDRLGIYTSAFPFLSAGLNLTKYHHASGLVNPKLDTITPMGDV